MRICTSCASGNPDTVERCTDCGTLLDAPRSNPLEDEIRGLLRDGKKIHAIKRYREESGVGLKEAKEAVEALSEGHPLPKPPKPDSANKAELDLVKAGRKIEAIKRYRERTGVGLREAKDAVERMAKEGGAPVGKSGCLSLLF